MNLKEAFRYQSFLEKRMEDARYSITDRNHAFTITKNHLKSKANPEAKDILETVETGEYVSNDDCILFMNWLIDERYKLTEAICKAKSSLDFCLDAALEANKFRQSSASSVKGMLRYTGGKKIEPSRDYKFNVEGNQTSYYYEVEVTYEENFNRDEAKKQARQLVEKSDEVSAKIDAAMINTQVNYDPVFNVNDSFEDVMADFIIKVKPNLAN